VNFFSCKRTRWHNCSFSFPSVPGFLTFPTNLTNQPALCSRNLPSLLRTRTLHSQKKSFLICWSLSFPCLLKCYFLCLLFADLPALGPYQQKLQTQGLVRQEHISRICKPLQRDRFFFRIHSFILQEQSRLPFSLPSPFLSQLSHVEAVLKEK